MNKMGNTLCEDFLKRFESDLDTLLSDRNHEKIASDRANAQTLLTEIAKLKPLKVLIPEDCNGLGGDISDCIRLLSIASYRSLALSLTFGINWALCIQPLQKFGQSPVRENTLRDMADNGELGGLMITEPGYGTDALSMKTSAQRVGDVFHIKGTKHWGGLTGRAKYWVLTCRELDDKRNLTKDVSMFLCDVSQAGQNIKVEELYQNAGLHMIPYGINQLDLKIPASHRMLPRSTGIRMMLDLLHRSRMQFPGMALGFVHRILDDAIAYCQSRVIGNASLISMDQVQQRLNDIQSAYTIISALCHFCSHTSYVDSDLSTMSFEANATKAVSTDLMQASAQSGVQLFGGKGYKLDEFMGRAIMDSRPFQIFEGSNDVLFIQNGTFIYKDMRRKKAVSFKDYLPENKYFKHVVNHVCVPSNIVFTDRPSQPELYHFGKIVSYVFIIGALRKLGQSGFRADLIASASTHLNKLIQYETISLKNIDTSGFVVDYQANAKWYQVASTSTV